MRCPLVLLVLLLASPSHAVVVTVDSTVDAADANPGDGICAGATVVCTLRAAVMETNALAGEDTIHLPAGTYQLAIPGSNENDSATGDLDVLGDLTLVGAGRESTTIDGAGIDRVLHAPDLAVRLTVSNLSITGGDAQPVEHRGSPGGGVFARYVVLTAVRIHGNRARWGGGLAIGGFFEGSMVGGALRMTDCEVSGNVAENEGGGIAHLGSLFEVDVPRSVVELSAIIANSAPSCAGGYSGESTLLNSTVSGNAGGGWCARNSPIHLVNSTVAANSGGAAGLAQECSGRPCRAVNVSLRGTIIAGNTPVNCIGPYGDPFRGISSGFNLDDDASCLQGLPPFFPPHPDDLIDTDPLLGPLQDNGGPTWTHALLPGSPAIDAIPIAECTWDDDGDPETPELALATDQRGVPRPQGVGCDIGAYELVPEPTRAMLHLAAIVVLIGLRRWHALP